MSKANPFRIEFPSEPKLIFREENKVTFIDERGEAASIAMTTHDLPPLEAAVIYQRRGLDDVRMFAGPAEQVIAAFRDFEARTARKSPGSTDKPSSRPVLGHQVIIGSSIAVIILAVTSGLGIYLTLSNRSAENQSTAKIEMLDRLAKQVEQISGDPGRPAPGSAAEAPALMPAGGPLNFKAAKVKQATPDVPASGPSLPPTPPAGAIAVPKDLPSLPRAEAEAHTDVTAAITDAEPAKDTSAPKVAIAVGPDPGTPLEAAAAPATKMDVANVSKIESKPETEPKSEGKPETKTATADIKPATGAKADGKIAPSGVAPMSPAEAQELLKTLEQIKSQAAEGGELTPELLKQLPMDVARQLVGTGIATVSPKERTERAQRMARIVRLPANIINQYRGRDGIASIPEQDTWVANGGRISIPLPGGGDILEPGNITEFGLTP